MHVSLSATVDLRNGVMYHHGSPSKLFTQEAFDAFAFKSAGPISSAIAMHFGDEAGARYAHHAQRLLSDYGEDVAGPDRIGDREQVLTWTYYVYLANLLKPGLIEDDAAALIHFLVTDKDASRAAYMDEAAIEEWQSYVDWYNSTDGLRARSREMMAEEHTGMRLDPRPKGRGRSVPPLASLGLADAPSEAFELALRLHCSDIHALGSPKGTRYQLQLPHGGILELLGEQSQADTLVAETSSQASVERLAAGMTRVMAGEIPCAVRWQATYQDGKLICSLRMVPVAHN